MRPLYLAASLLLCLGVSAQQTLVLTSDDYAHAEKFLTYATSPLVLGAGVRPNWIAGGDRFWYRVTRAKGAEFVLVDPAKGTKTAAFDQKRLAAALNAATGVPGSRRTTAW